GPGARAPPVRVRGRQMRPFRLRRRQICVAGLAGLIFAAGAAPVTLAQEYTGPVLSATISQRFEADSNFRLDNDSPGTSYFADTPLAIGYDNETPTQSFSLGFDTGLRALWEARDDDEDDFELEVASPTTARLG